MSLHEQSQRDERFHFTKTVKTLLYIVPLYR